VNQKIIKCDLHDYIEVACIYKIEVRCIFQDGSHLTGIPLTTKVGKDKKEYLTFNANDRESVTSISLLDLKSMQAMETNPHFDKVTFSYE
jgi:Rho-binding antiterminator